MEVLQKIYYGECHHIFCDDIQTNDCIHRYFDVIDPMTNFYGRVVVCNEFLRLKVREHHFSVRNSITYSYNNSWKDSYEDVVDKIIDDALYKNPQKKSAAHYEVGTLNPAFGYSICNRPYIVKRTTLHAALDVIIGKPYNFYDNGLRNSVSCQIKYLAGHVLKYAKYKKYHNEMAQIIKKLDQSSAKDDGIYYSELMILFFELLTNKKRELCNQ